MDVCEDGAGVSQVSPDCPFALSLIPIGRDSSHQLAREVVNNRR